MSRPTRPSFDMGLVAYRLTADRAELTAQQTDPTAGFPCSNDAQAIFTDFYQLTMMYAYWKAGKHLDEAVFDVYFRRCPFEGEFAVFAGVNEAIRFINTLRFSPSQIQYLKQVLIDAEPSFFEYIERVDGSDLTIYAVKEGSLVFPNVPVVRVEGPLGIAQLIETPLLNLLNYPSLIATNAARHRLVAGWDKELLEFGARRAQGPDGAMSASRYSYLGGFDGTSNVRAGHIFGIPIKGTHAHAFVSSFNGLSELSSRSLYCPSKRVACDDFVSLVTSYRDQLRDLWPQLGSEGLLKEGELTAFIAYAQAFPTSCLCLVDTYETLSCGIPNFLSVALALDKLGLRPIGIRLDSGDLAYLSQRARQMFREVSKHFGCCLADMKIVASNDINEKVLISLNDQKHEIDTFGIGTNLVTCQAQPALGMVYKLAEINKRPTMKSSQETGKTSIPSKKNVYRVYTKSGEPVVDLLLGYKEPKPQQGVRFFCCHLFDSNKRFYVVPDFVEELLVLFWEKGVCQFKENLEESRERCIHQLKLFRKDILRPLNPTPYKVSTSSEFFQFFRLMWEQTAPIFTLE